MTRARLCLSSSNLPELEISGDFVDSFKNCTTRGRLEQEGSELMSCNELSDAAWAISAADGTIDSPILHLVTETPRAYLADGMKWLLVANTKRVNIRTNRYVRLFARRS